MKKTVVKRRRKWTPKLPLSPQEKKLRACLNGSPKPFTMLAVPVLGLTAKQMTKLAWRRRARQRLGAIAARHNAKVKSLRIEPGEKRGTLRLSRVR